MADIDVVRKSSRAWIWILMIVILALVAWFAFGASRTHTVGQLEHRGQPHVAAVPTQASA